MKKSNGDIFIKAYNQGIRDFDPDKDPETLCPFGEDEIHERNSWYDGWRRKAKSYQMYLMAMDKKRKRIKRYIILESGSSTDLSEQVQQALDKGAELLGGLCAASISEYNHTLNDTQIFPMFYQALIYMEESDGKSNDGTEDNL